MATKHKIQTLNDLNIMTHQLFKKYDLEKTYNEPCLEIWKKYIPSMTMVEMKEAHRNHLCIIDICEMNGLSDETVRQLSDELLIVRKSKSCKFNEFVLRAAELRNKFLETRSNYFVRARNLNIDDEENTKDPLNIISEILLGNWIEKTLYEIYPKEIDITYESETGKIIHTKISQKKLEMNNDSVEAPPIDRWIGVSWIDSFYYKGFWDCKNKQWVRIPICLIIDMSSNHVEELRKRSETDTAENSDEEDLL